MKFYFDSSEMTTEDKNDKIEDMLFDMSNNKNIIYGDNAESWWRWNSKNNAIEVSSDFGSNWEKMDDMSDFYFGEDTFYAYLCDERVGY